nr:MAG TPA: hypothetical protein [Caudoviricetes sp.]
MIKVETYEQDGHRIYRSSIQGRLPDIIYDAALTIRNIYDALDRKNHDDAELYRRFVTSTAGDDKFWTAANIADEAVFVDMSNIKRGGKS